MALEKIVNLDAELRGAKAARQSAQLALDSSVGDNPTAVAEAMARLAKARYNLEHITNVFNPF